MNAVTVPGDKGRYKYLTNTLQISHNCKMETILMLSNGLCAKMLYLLSSSSVHLSPNIHCIFIVVVMFYST